ncbi:MAG: glycerate kinase, partial [Ilumatobacteraceae bacterium]
KRIVVCLGGSATTDGGLGCVRAISAPARLKAVQLLVACDVQTKFVDAAPVFAPQKGATPAQVDMLKGRLERLVQLYREQFGVDVRDLPGTGAAGGLAGGLVALGGRLQPGFDLVADEIDLHDKIAAADLVITGEGYLDEQSFEGKVIGGVQELCESIGRRVAAVVGDSAESVRHRIEHRSIARDHGLERALREPLWCIEQSARDLLRSLTASAG